MGSGHKHTFILLAATALGAVAVPAPALAHISLEMAGTHLSRSGDGQTALKGEPCGVTGSTRGTHIYEYEPGATIQVSVIETIPHPGYFRIAFDDDGDDGFEDPQSIKPIDPARGCPCTSFGCSASADHCSADDFYNNSTVLPNMDNLDPHTTAAAGTKYTWSVTLPNVECDNCTLQIIQVMEDPLGHGPYDNNSDVYHQCIDLVLKHGASGGAAGSSGVAGESGGGAAGVTGTAGDAGSSGTIGGGSGAGAPQAGAGAIGGGSGLGGSNPGGGAAAGAGGDLGAGSPNNSSSDSGGGCSAAPGNATGLLAPLALALLVPALRRTRRRPRSR